MAPSYPSQYRLDSTGLKVLWNKMKEYVKKHGGSFDVDKVYPVGAIYMSSSSTNPSNLFGGTWQSIQGKFLLSASGDYPAGSSGGSANAVVVSHTHTQASHTHNANGNGFCSYILGDSGISRTRVKVDSSGRFAHLGISGKTTADSSGLRFNSVTNSVTPKINSTGSSGEGANMPPYLSVYVWERIS